MKSVTIKSPWSGTLTLTTQWFLGWKVEKANGGPLGPLNASVSTSLSEGDLVLSVQGLAAGETISSISPDDGRFTVDQTRTLVLRGSAILNVGSISLVITTTNGRTLSVSLSVNAQQTLSFGSTRLRVPNRMAQPNTSSSFLSVLNHISAGSPAYDITDIRVCIPGFYCNNGGGTPTERMMTNEFGAAYWLELSGVRHRASFGGQPWTQRGGTGASKGLDTPFDWGVWSDVILSKTDGQPLVIPANSNIFHCSLARVENVGDSFPASQYLAAAVGDTCRSTTEASGAALESIADGSGSIATLGSAPAQQFVPMYMVGRRVDNGDVVSVLIVGDSRNYNANDFATGLPATEPRAALSSLERGFDDIATGRIATGNASMPGSSPAQTFNGVFNGTDYAPGMTHRVAPLLALKGLYDGQLPFTDIVDGHTGNGNFSYETLRDAHVSTLRAYFPGVKMHKMTLPPRVGTTSTDAYKSLAGQTPSGYDLYPSGGKAVVNAAILANVGSVYDSVFDYGKTVSAAANLDEGDPNYNEYRSKFPTAPRSALVATQYTGAATIVLKSSLRVGDTIALNDDRTKIAGPIRLIVDNGNGTWTHTFQTGSNPSGVDIAVDTNVVVVPTKDGTHEEPWLHYIGGQAIATWKQTAPLG